MPKPDSEKPSGEIMLRNLPDDILKEAKRKQEEKWAKCNNCLYSLGKSLVDYIRELQRGKFETAKK